MGTFGLVQGRGQGGAKCFGGKYITYQSNLQKYQAISKDHFEHAINFLDILNYFLGIFLLYPKKGQGGINKYFGGGSAHQY